MCLYMRVSLSRYHIRTSSLWERLHHYQTLLVSVASQRRPVSIAVKPLCSLKAVSEQRSSSGHRRIVERRPKLHLRYCSGPALKHSKAHCKNRLGFAFRKPPSTTRDTSYYTPRSLKPQLLCSTQAVDPRKNPQSSATRPQAAWPSKVMKL